jgi:exopolysaccharide production protein ExoY
MEHQVDTMEVLPDQVNDTQSLDNARHAFLVIGQPQEYGSPSRGAFHHPERWQQRESSPRYQQPDEILVSLGLDGPATPTVSSDDSSVQGTIVSTRPDAVGPKVHVNAVATYSAASELWKRAFDSTLALLLIIILLPLLAVVALLVRVTSPGPIIFRQVRVGQYGRPFVLWKFRTMTNGAEQLLEQDSRLKEEFRKRWKLGEDPRITPLGRWLRKTSIDELPQLINVLRGEMSMVGPRPVQPAELGEQYGEYSEVVFTAKPGITGLWQVAGRSSSSYAERVALDLEYVQRRGGWFDLLIVMRTIPAVLLMRDAA